MDLTANFRFYGTLNDFLSPREKNRWLSYAFQGKPAVKDAIEALGVPHPEVHAILMNDIAVGFVHSLQAQAQVAVYPLDHLPLLPEGYSLRPSYPGIEKFILDVHLGKLSRSLRMLGFDCYYENQQTDQEIAARAEKENRIVLSRDVGLLKHKAIHWGYWLRSQDPQEQVGEVIRYFKLLNKFRPFTRCLSCNGRIEETAKERIVHKLPPQTRQFYKDFYQCLSCKKVYWKGSHYERMQEFLAGFQGAGSEKEDR